MDFLDKALKKALGEQPSIEAARTPIPQASAAVMPPAPEMVEDLVEEIRYTHTRTLPVSTARLRSQKILTGIDGPAGEAYKLLRTHIVQLTRMENRNLLMITGPQSSEGKTLTAINLAISLSHEMDKTVLLVDADLRRPTVHEYFGWPQGPGFVDYLNGSNNIPELLVHPEGFSKLVILPGGKPNKRAAELIGSPMMMELTQEIKHFYSNRYVIFDLPPVLSFADPLAFAPLMDGIILVVEMGKTLRQEIQRCSELLKDFPVLGAVLNKVKATEPGYHDNAYPNN
jgi:protein-tyrosine kinase